MFRSKNYNELIRVQNEALFAVIYRFFIFSYIMLFAVKILSTILN
jgi:hypothetical protein